MTKSFRAYQPEQRLLLPADLREWLPEGHLARFLSDLIERLDLSAIYRGYEEDGRGQAAYHPLLMVKVWFYGLATRRYSSRQLEAACVEDLAVRYLAANQGPDHSTLAEFRRRHEAALAGLFGQILQLCDRAGLVSLGHVAIDGTKIRANASKRRTRSYREMRAERQRLEQLVKDWLQRAEETDTADQARHGSRRGDELPLELATQAQRLETIQRLQAEMEREAREEAAQEKEEIEQRRAERSVREQEEGRRFGGRTPQVPDPEQARPAENAQRNGTDPDSRIMRDGATGSLQQSYNAQVAVDEKRQIIVAADGTPQANDRVQLAPMAEQIERGLQRKPRELSADSDFFNSRMLASPWLAGIDVYVPPEPERRLRAGPAARRWDRRPDLTDAMRAKFRTEQGRQRYRKRQGIVEPVFGVIKQWRGFRQFSVRGLERVRHEWRMICAVHNICKLHRAATAASPA